VVATIAVIIIIIFACHQKNGEKKGQVTDGRIKQNEPEKRGEFAARTILYYLLQLSTSADSVRRALQET
jgi:hypothetical protein